MGHLFRIQRTFKNVTSVILIKTSSQIWFPFQIDHFNFANETTFKQKYLINKKHWENKSDPSGPIFFYTGNEGDIEAFANNTVSTKRCSHHTATVRETESETVMLNWDSRYLCHFSTEMAEIWSPSTSIQDVWTNKVSATSVEK